MSKPQERLFDIGVRVAEIEMSKKALEDERVKLQQEHEHLLDGITSGKRNGKIQKNGKTAKTVAAEEPEEDEEFGSRRARNTRANEMRLKVLAVLPDMDKEFTDADVIKALPDEEEERVVICLRDMRSRLKWLDKPKRGVWELSAIGRREVRRASAASSDAE